MTSVSGRDFVHFPSYVPPEQCQILTNPGMHEWEVLATIRTNSFVCAESPLGSGCFLELIFSLASCHPSKIYCFQLFSFIYLYHSRTIFELINS